MKLYKIILALALLIVQDMNAQQIPSNRRTNWANSGYQGSLPTPTVWKDIMTFGGNKTGASDNTTAFNNAVASLSGAAGIVYFPAGTYLFTSSLNVPANVIVKGASSDSTTLNFNLGGATANGFNVTGTASTTPIAVIAGGTLGSTSLTLTSASGINIGDYIEFRVDGGSFMTSSWAVDDLAQICKVTAIAGNTITLEKPLRWHFNQSTNPRVYTTTPVQKVGFECFKITRLDSPSDQTTHISFTRAANCWVKGVEGFKTMFSHVQFTKSIYCEVSESYFHHSWNYGGNGRGYGVCIQSSTSECLIQNNIFEHLRHGTLFQSGANGNVLGYNYYTDPYWTEGFFPTNSCGEIVAHGNFPFMNLFEGNVLDNIVLDNSHGINGPFNTVFRNRGILYGIFMNTGAGDSFNFVNNEVPSSAPFATNSYTLTGSGHYQYGNSKAGTIVPTGTSTPPDWASYYLTGTPAWFTSGTLPTVGLANSYNSGTIPAKTRYTAGVLNRCTCPTRVQGCGFDFVYFNVRKSAYCCGDLYEITINAIGGAGYPVNVYVDGIPQVVYSSNSKIYIGGTFNKTIQLRATDAQNCQSSSVFNVFLP